MTGARSRPSAISDAISGGREIIPLLSEIAVNKLDPFPPMRVKQLVLAGHDGYLIADAILFREDEEFFRIVGAPFASDWVQVKAERGRFDVDVQRDDNFAVRSGTRDVFHVQVQGPDALALMEDVIGGRVPSVKFFHIGELVIAGKTVRALRHGMAGEPGFEIYGAWDDQAAVHDALETAGEQYGMRRVGALAYSTTAQDSGWMPMPLPAIYHSAEMKPYRYWLNSYFLETIGSLGGSLVSDDITDYCVDPIELGYGRLIDFDRDFVGRNALVERSQNPRRAKATLEWHDDDATAVMRDSLFKTTGPPAKFMSLPLPMYATFQSDAVLKDDETVGVSQWPAFCANSNHFISLALLDLSSAEPGTEVILVWGEPDSVSNGGGARTP